MAGVSEKSSAVLLYPQVDPGAPTCDGLSLSVSASLQWLVLLEDLTEKGPHSPCHFSSLGSSLTLTLLWSPSISEPITVAGDGTR